MTAQKRTEHVHWFPVNVAQFPTLEGGWVSSNRLLLDPVRLFSLPLYLSASLRNVSTTCLPFHSSVGVCHCLWLVQGTLALRPTLHGVGRLQSHTSWQSRSVVLSVSFGLFHCFCVCHSLFVFDGKQVEKSHMAVAMSQVFQSTRTPIKTVRLRWHILVWSFSLLAAGVNGVLAFTKVIDTRLAYDVRCSVPASLSLA